MAIEFPANKFVGDTFPYQGMTYVWDGEKWTASGAAAFEDVYVNIEGDQMTGDLTVPSLNGGPLSGLRNQIINGDFRVWQRGTDFTSSSSPSFTADHWRTAAKRTVKRVKFAGNYGVEVTGTQGTSPYIAQPIELQGDALSGPFVEGQEYTISFTVNNSVAADVTVEMRHRIGSNDNTGEQEVVPKTVVASGITATQRVSHTFTYTSAMRPAADKTCCLLEITNSVVDSTMKITQVQLECGPVETPFEQRPMGLELQLCQRYYYPEWANAYAYTHRIECGSSTGNGFFMPYPGQPQMRTSPTLIGELRYYENRPGSSSTAMTIKQVQNRPQGVMILFEPISTNSAVRIFRNVPALDAEL